MHATADLNLRQVNYLVNKQKEIQIQMESQLNKNNMTTRSRDPVLNFKTRTETDRNQRINWAAERM
jgi:hypothetical protein